MRKVTLAVLLLSCLLWTPATAEDLSGRFGLGIEGGVMKLIHGDNDYSNVDEFVGLRLRYGLSQNWVLNFSSKTGWVRPGVENPEDKAGFSFDSFSRYYTTIHNPEFGVQWRIAPQSSFDPYLGLAAGVVIWDVHDQSGIEMGNLEFPDGPTAIGYDTNGNSQELSATNFNLGFTLGFEWFISSHWGLDFGARYHYMFGNDKDNIGMSEDAMWGPTAVDANTALVDGFVGLTYYFGSADSDGDGIANKVDDCPDDPEDFDNYMDEDGCPDPDNDGDGVLDVDDECPNEAEDRDGYLDEDGCPDPDNDGDGILDAEDRCPDEAEDFDGYMDEDGCPDPDNDGDGVLDADDRCPNTPPNQGVDASGCPLIEALPDQVLLREVEFEFGSAELTGSSAAVLDKIAAALLAYPDESAEIGGHTDSSGPAEFNKKLSKQRAESVRQYLILKGIDASRLTSVGYGEDKPVADNATKEGRAQNRRVEIIMSR